MKQQTDGRRGRRPRRRAGPGEPVEKTAHVKGIEDDLRQRLAVQVEIKVKAKDNGQIVIGFDSNDDFERIIAGAAESLSEQRSLRPDGKCASTPATHFQFLFFSVTKGATR